MAIGKPLLRKQEASAGSKTRVQGVTGDQTVKATAGILHRIVVTNAAAAVGSITLKDGATTLGVFEVGVDTTLTLVFGCNMDTSIIINPSASTMDALVIWD